MNDTESLRISPKILKCGHNFPVNYSRLTSLESIHVYIIISNHCQAIDKEENVKQKECQAMVKRNVVKRSLYFSSPTCDYIC